MVPGVLQTLAHLGGLAVDTGGHQGRRGGDIERGSRNADRAGGSSELGDYGFGALIGGTVALISRMSQGGAQRAQKGRMDLRFALDFGLGLAAGGLLDGGNLDLGLGRALGWCLSGCLAGCSDAQALVEFAELAVGHEDGTVVAQVLVQRNCEVILVKVLISISLC